MRKIFTLIASALLAGGVSAQTGWNFSDWEAKDYTETVTIDGLTVTATADAKITIDGSNKTVDEVKYTQRLKTGGSGGENSRTLSFAVEGACKIEVILCSASGSENRLLNICAGTYKKEEYLTQLDAVAGDPAKQTYTYTGEATTIYLGSYNSGINIYAIYVTPAGDSGEQPGEGDDQPGEGGETEGVAPILVKDATTNGNLVVPEVIVDPAKAENHCIKVASPANAAEEWDAQIFISAPEAFKEGDVIALAMSIKADAAQAEAGCQLHSTPGNYQHWQATGIANFTTEWTEYKGQYTITKKTSDDGTDGIGAQTLAFNLSVKGGSANNLYFDDIVLTVNGKEVINESFGDSVAAGIIFVKTQDGENGATYNLAGQKVDENYKGVVIKNGKKFIQK